MKKIRLTKNKYALVDDDIFPKLNKFKWHFTNGYATTDRYLGKIKGKYKSAIIKMHRLVLNAPFDLLVDHINGNKLDNRRENIRVCTKAQNEVNKPKRKGNYKSQYKGVAYSENRRKHWMTRVAGIFVGYFNDEIEAAKAYDKKVFELYGKYAKLNFA